MHEPLHPHDLVRLNARAVARLNRDLPEWAAQSLQRAPWAAVRRSHVRDAVAIGVRGVTRAQRLATTVAADEIERVITPEMLAGARAPREHGAFTALCAVMRAATGAGLRAGPIGAAGFELATGVPALRDDSDLDVLVRAQPTDLQLSSFAREIADLPLRVDVEVAFADNYGAALEEALRGGELMVKTPGGPRMLPRFSPPQAAVQALIAEVELTPKPALVDRRGSGAHVDLTLELLLRSAQALGDTFAAVFAAARGATLDGALRARLGAIGREGEARMLRATGGVNTHRGAIWSLGLLIAAHAITAGRDPRALARTAAGIAAYADPARGGDDANGARARARYGVGGAVGEAANGFPHVVEVALPRLRAARRRGASEAVARIDALLAIMTTLDDTCLLHRGGLAALRAAQTGAAATLAAGGAGTAGGLRALGALEADLLARGASPGGAADLLAATLFLDSLERGTWV